MNGFSVRYPEKLTDHGWEPTAIPSGTVMTWDFNGKDPDYLFGDIAGLAVRVEIIKVESDCTLTMGDGDLPPPWRKG